jgi:hypothetical protein
MKAAALEIIRQAEAGPQSWVPAHARGEQDLWTFRSVKDVLVDSYTLLRRTGGRVGPQALKAVWPEHQVEQGDFVQQSLNRTLRHHSGRPQTSTEQQSRMEQVLLGWTDEAGQHQPGWLAGPLLIYPEFREKLIAWTLAEVRGEPLTALCERRRWVVRTAERHRDRAAGIIADRLNRSGVGVW